MKKIFLKKNFIIIIVLFLFTCISCGPENNTLKKNLQKKSLSKKKTVKNKASSFKKKVFKKKKSIKKVFQIQAIITSSDGTIFEVDDFAFYSKHRGFSGGMYYPSSGDKLWDFYLKQGVLWKKIDFNKVKSMEFKKEKKKKRWSKQNWTKIDVHFIDGSKEKGSFPFYAYKYLWARHGQAHLSAKSKVLGRYGNIKCKLSEVLSIKRIEKSTSDNVVQFQLLYGGKEINKAIISNPSIRLIWKKSKPTYLDTYKIKSLMPVIINNTSIKIKPIEMDTLIIPVNFKSYFSIKMKNGETAKVKKIPPRVFGRLKNGDVIFSEFFNNKKRIIKEVRLK